MMRWQGNAALRYALLAVAVIGAMAAGLLPVPPALAQEIAEVTDCDDIRYMMQTNITPYDLLIEGGALELNIPAEGQLGPDKLADFWVFRLEESDDDAVLEVTFDKSADFTTLDFEFALFHEMLIVGDDANDRAIPTYQRPVGETYTYTLDEPGIYTLVIQRRHISDTVHVGPYRFTARLLSGFAGPDIYAEALPVPQNASVETLGGRQLVTLAGGESIVVNAGGLRQITDTSNRREITLSSSGRMAIGRGWVASFAGGNLAVRSQSDAGEQIFYYEGFNFRTSLSDITLKKAGDFSSDWQGIQGVWILDECMGFRLRQGGAAVSFLAPMNGGTAHKITINGAGGNPCLSLKGLTAPTQIIVPAVNSVGETKEHTLCLTWEGIQPASEVVLENGILRAHLAGERTLELESNRITALARHPLPDVDEADYPWLIVLNDPEGAAVRFTLDWKNMAAFAYKGTNAAPPDERCPGVRCLTFTFAETNAPRTVTTRNGDGLASLEARHDIIRLVYRGERNLPGEEHLLLPESDSFVELVTPPGPATYNGAAFDGMAMPGQPGYAPRAMNNTGGECYPVNTLLTDINCAANGYPNPANGNLWYTVTDHRAHGYLIDLMLTRSYNTASAALDGPFGYGWSTDFMLDYNLAFDAATNSRVVTPQNVNLYRVGLDLTQAPRGIILYNTPSGSRHVFRAQEDGYYTALTMPGWVLYRPMTENLFGERQPDYASPWQLFQSNGLQITFDRAGRLTAYGYPAENRMVTVNYAYVSDLLNGPGSYGGSESPVVITDAIEQRRLELYYDTNHHIVRSVLRDLVEHPDTLTACSLAANCFETLYTYDDRGRLIIVNYPDKQVATYLYDDASLLIGHVDPRAPVAPAMTYTYVTNRIRTADIVGLTLEPDEHWRSLVYGETGNEFQTTVTDEYGNERLYRYVKNSGDAARAGDTFTLKSIDLDTTEPFNSRIAYTWSDGLVTGVVITRGRSEHRINLTYDRWGQITAITDGGVKRFEVLDTADALLFGIFPVPRQFRYADGSVVMLTYPEGDNATLDFMRWQDGYGAVYQPLQRDTNGRIQILARGSLTENNTFTENMRWTYAYNPAGLTLNYFQQRPDGSVDYAVGYRWDGLGRLIGLEDAILGTYRITYTTLDCSSTPVCQEIRLTDPVGAVTIARFDGRGRLIERILTTDETGTNFLRRTVYRYDDYLGRLTAEIQWVNAAAQCDTEAGAADENCLITTYRYVPLNISITDTRGAGAIILVGTGYSVVQTDPAGRERRFDYDMHGRLLRTIDETGHETQYAYLNAGSDLQIRQIDLYAAAPLVHTFNFDRTWQLSGVQQLAADGRSAVQAWNFAALDQNNLLGMRADAELITRMTWGRAESGPGLVGEFALEPRAIALEGRNYTPPGSNIVVEYDALGRPVSIGERLTERGSREGERRLYTLITYCNAANGATRVIYQRTEDAAARLDCDTPGGFDATVLVYDIHGRVIEITDEFGTRTFSYPLPAENEHEWNVLMTAISPNSGDVLEQQFTYNAVGELVAWTDDSGVTRTYTFDLVGRLLTINASDDSPESHLEFTYNRSGQVVLVKDGVGRGYTMEYNAQGRPVVRRDIPAGEVTSYTYNADGLIATVTGPGGLTTQYLYEDTNDPRLLTGIIDPAGQRHSFTWDFDDHTLTYTDPLLHETIYAFDSAGALWLVKDALNRVHTLEYDARGNLLRWRYGGERDRFFELSYDATFLAETSVRILARDGDEVLWEGALRRTPAGFLAGPASQEANGPSFVYDALGRLSEIHASDAEGSSLYFWTLTRTPGSSTITYETGAGPATVTFDPLFRLRQIENAGQQIRYEYSAAPNEPVRLILTDNNRQAEYRLDYQQNVIEYRADGQFIRYRYNHQSQLVVIESYTCVNTTTPAAESGDVCGEADDARLTQLVRFTYNALGQVTQIVQDDTSIETFEYDIAGNLSRYQDSGGRSYVYGYDALNRLVSLRLGDGTLLLFNYDLRDKVTGICQTRVEAAADFAACVEQNGLLEAYTYDISGHLREQRFPNLVPANERNGQSAVTYTYNRVTGLLETRSIGPNTVELTYTDALQLLNSIGGDETYTFAFDSGHQFDWNHINYLASVQSSASADASLAYTYTADGRLETLTAGSHTLTYAYEADGYQVRDENGAGLRVTTDAYGFIVGVRNIWSQQIRAASFQGTFSYDILDNMTLGIRVEWSDGTGVDITLAARSAVLDTTYTGPDVRFHPEIDGSGLLRREIMTGSPEIFGSAGSYSIVNSYDDAGRPQMTRIVNEAGSPVYQVNFTYGPRGQRTREVRQYADGTQLIIDYGYADTVVNRGDVLAPHQLVRRVVRLQPPGGNLQFSWILLPALLLVSTPVLLRYPRSRIMALLALFGLFVITAAAQDDDPNTVEFTYQYDAAGNLTDITADNDFNCASYRYDSAGRLIEATTADGRVIPYSYDVYNRLVSDGQRTFVSEGQRRLPAYVYGADNDRFYGRVHDRLTLFEAGLNAAATVIQDGFGQPRTLLAGKLNERAVAPWLFDALGRIIIPGSAPLLDVSDPCFIGTLPLDTATLAVPALIVDNLLFDPQTHLAFASDGRAYSPDLGRYLQRDPLGPDVTGNVYEYPSRRLQPPFQQQTPGFTAGLTLLWDVLALAPDTGALTAAGIWAQYQPAGSATSPNAFLGLLDTPGRRYMAQWQQRLNFPAWLLANYNQPGPQIDAQTGHLGWPLITFPGQQSGNPAPLLDFSAPFWQGNLWQPSGMTGSVETLARVMNGAAPRTQFYRLYHPQTWAADMVTVADIGVNPAGRLDLRNTPGGVLNYLPSPLAAPQFGADYLTLALRLETLPGQTGAAWVADSLQRGLPALPRMPFLEVADWRNHWFGAAMPGPEQNLTAMFKLPGLPAAPSGSIYPAPLQWWINYDAVAPGDESR